MLSGAWNDDPVRVAVAAHRHWMLDEFAGIAAEAGVDDVDATARQLMILRDGAMVNGYLGEASSVADSLGTAFASIVTTAAPGPSVSGPR